MSLHSHSHFSREKLDFVPGIARRVPLVRWLFERSMVQYERNFGRPLDFAACYWRPPLTPAAVIESERRQIADRFDCEAFVSLTDHDTLEGPKLLRRMGQQDVPLSVEWSVDFDGAVFHLGVHGLPPGRIQGIEPALAACTDGSPGRLGQILAWLAESRETFVVLNHPYWDLGGIGALRHDAALLRLLRTHGDRIHALELNGYRDWNENRRVLPLAEALDLPVVGGGDRHSCLPNTIVNLTAATCLAEFAHELRARRRAYCVVLPDYRKPLNARVLETAADVARRLPGPDGGTTRWSERVFITTAEGVEVSVQSLWNGAPWWLSISVAATRLLGSAPVRPLFDLTRADGGRVLEADCQAAAMHDVFGGFETPRSAAVA